MLSTTCCRNRSPRRVESSQDSTRAANVPRNLPSEHILFQTPGGTDECSASAQRLKKYPPSAKSDMEKKQPFQAAQQRADDSDPLAQTSNVFASKATYCFSASKILIATTDLFCLWMSSLHLHHDPKLPQFRELCSNSLIALNTICDMH